jgi:hypothetical protein
MEYKEYPLHISHWNPNSPDYVHSEREELIMHNHVADYNTIINDLKLGFKL